MDFYKEKFLNAMIEEGLLQEDALNNGNTKELLFQLTDNIFSDVISKPPVTYYFTIAVMRGVVMFERGLLEKFKTVRAQSQANFVVAVQEIIQNCDAMILTSQGADMAKVPFEGTPAEFGLSKEDTNLAAKAETMLELITTAPRLIPVYIKQQLKTLAK